MGDPSSDGERGLNYQLPQEYLRACALAEAGQRDQARELFRALAAESLACPLKALVHNNLGVLDVVDGNSNATTEFTQALELYPECQSAHENERTLGQQGSSLSEPAVCERHGADADECDIKATAGDRSGETKIAVVSLLFNWPATGGGNIHTVELADFLGRAGYTIRHFYAHAPGWGLGSVDEPLPIESTPIDFDEQAWSAQTIQQRYRKAVDEFEPDAVIITDCWNFKPLLAEAFSGYRYFLRQQALECLCPLNNLRLLDGGGAQCGQNQLATPTACLTCLSRRANQSGRLHQAERKLAGVGTELYEKRLRRALEHAEAVLVLNPLIREMFSPFTRRVEVVPWGMDSSRFPWPWPDEQPADGEKQTIFMAGVVAEGIKGFQVLHTACEQLWKNRQDFELLATGTPPGQVDDFTSFTGWLSQNELPRYLRRADIVVVPTIAQEGLSRTSVEAMAVGRPVIASRIGGLPYTVTDGVTGLLFRPGDSADLAEKLERLMDDSPTRQRMGLSGRRRFEDEFTWDVVIERAYRPLLNPLTRTHASQAT